MEVNTMTEKQEIIQEYTDAAISFFEEAYDGLTDAVNGSIYMESSELEKEIAAARDHVATVLAKLKAYAKAIEPAG
jgi:hypothetical protein